ncbi:MAG: bifunctional 5,10-methylene-tetrahydrofolate dehydrogenase/5,10-methylene-tetrahydrofolate cyclohydrolase, partial [candidate division KSB1 bacterium]|nr:bifunctional 5,10-methylene-tetrahydrofolate dehydrogenase/5,10-methylene-tetrahydrofolate cyclohydrolase [candidate division KSB1 bacterium]
MIIDGKKIADQVKLELIEEIHNLKQQGVIPGLATILVGENPASATYVQM